MNEQPRMTPPHGLRPLSRRKMLCQCANGFGALALTSLLGETAFGELLTDAADANNPMAPRPSHFPPKAKSVIFLFMDGGPSQVDTFDPKPRLAREHGKPIQMKIPHTQFNNIGNVMASPWEFRQYGQSGIPVSAIFPHVATCIDDVAVIRSMVAEFSNHTQGNFFMHSGKSMQGWPSMGSWITYGLGSESQNLPGFVVLDSGLIPPGGQGLFDSGFLPASFQGSLFRGGDKPVADIDPAEPSPDLQRGKFDLMRKLNQNILEKIGPSDQIESMIANYELAFRMQAAVPELMDLKGESKATRDLYGVDEEATAKFGRQCLIARRLVERGVRFIELLPPKIPGNDRWDQHTGFKKGHASNALATDKPIAGLIKDLKSRGLLDQTLIVWGGEFGRTPMAQGTDGRDHNPFGFSMWLAGGGVKGGTIHGQTDDYGYFAIENKTTIYDLHATILHLLGIDHKRLTYRHSSRDMRLTDVHGEVIHPIVA